MEENIFDIKEVVVPEHEINRIQESPFILANTKDVTLGHLKDKCTIPVFSKDNECTIAHHEFISSAHEVTKRLFKGHPVTNPEIRVSHVIKGRIPTAIGKPVKELKEHEKTIYYERMMFKIDIPSITTEIDNNRLNLVVGGVRAYNRENLYNKKNMEKFKLFIGFKNRVCCNLCVSSDGSVADIRASGIQELESKIMEVIGGYEMQHQIETMKSMTELRLTEKQFALFIGRSRLYQYLPVKERQGIAKLELSDGQINAVAKGYYEDENFSKGNDNQISLWRFYNLLTGANKSSYIDTFVDRSLNAYELTQTLGNSIKHGGTNFYLN